MSSHFLLKFPLKENEEIRGLQLFHQVTHALDEMGSNSAFEIHQVLNSSNIVAFSILQSSTHVE
jgi:hypothetical protein